MEYLTADQLRQTFLDFYIEREHTLMGSMSLIPTHPAAPLFTNAGMVQFLSYFFAEEAPPFPRATSSQKCLRVRGKHDDIENVGRTTRHLTFFEMLGNFSFGDYFKSYTIEMAWEFLTGRLGFEAERLWVTIHDSDDEAGELWQELVGLPAERIQRAGEDNFWEMGATGPCGPSSELFYDRGAEFGAGGGPIGGGEERYVEIWNLVFMSLNRLEDGRLEPLPNRNIDTGAGLERILPIVQGVTSVFESNVMRQLIDEAAEATGAIYGRDPETDVSLRIIADHARSATFLIGDGMVPSNEERGYVLRRIIRRAVRHAQGIGDRSGVLPAMAAAVSTAMQAAYPELTRDLNRISEILEREEHRFLDTLGTGVRLLDEAIGDASSGELSGEVSFKLHDTHGFPIDLTEEIARERGFSVDRKAYEEAMASQREQARAAAKTHVPDASAHVARAVLDSHGPTEFVGYEQLEAEAPILAVESTESGGPLQVFTATTPFYAGSGGQIGDRGEISTGEGRGRVIDTDAPIPGVIRHLVELEAGSLRSGQLAGLRVDADRRQGLCRSHTATHLIHWALRKKLGSQVRQQGSFVGPDHLRFDFNHHSALDEEELQGVERLVVEQIIGDAPVRTESMSLPDAKETGAMSFFGEKYGDMVRVVRAGEDSVELCGGTHVASLGRIGDFLIQSEASVGANLRRIEALTGIAAHDAIVSDRKLLHTAAGELKVPVDAVPDAIRRMVAAERAHERERRRLAAELDGFLARELVESAENGIVIARCDGRDQQGMRELIERIKDRPGVSAIAVAGAVNPESAVVGVAAADFEIQDLARRAAQEIGGGAGGRDPHLSIGGGKNPAGVDSALRLLKQELIELGGGGGK